jgi:hypothetical protein
MRTFGASEETVSRVIQFAREFRDPSTWHRETRSQVLGGTPGYMEGPAREGRHPSDVPYFEDDRDPIAPEDAARMARSALREGITRFVEDPDVRNAALGAMEDSPHQ